MNRKSRLTTFIIFHSILCWLSLAAAAQPLTSRSATANSYLERGNVWFAKGDLERAIADYGLAIASDPNFPYGYYVSFRQQCMIVPGNHALLPKAYVLICHSIPISSLS